MRILVSRLRPTCSDSPHDALSSVVALISSSDPDESVLGELSDSRERRTGTGVPVPAGALCAGLGGSALEVDADGCEGINVDGVDGTMVLALFVVRRLGLRIGCGSSRASGSEVDEDGSGG